MTKEELITKAQKLIDESFIAKENGNRFLAIALEDEALKIMSQIVTSHFTYKDSKDALEELQERSETGKKGNKK